MPKMTAYEFHMTKRLVRLEAALELMRKEAMYGQVTNDPNWDLYSCAAECIEKEVFKVRKAIM